MSTPLPQHCPSARELDDLELLGAGAIAGVEGFNEHGSPVTLTLPAPVATAAESAGAVELVDPEGLPLARVSWPEGRVEPLAHTEFGPFRRLHLTPADLRRESDRAVVPVDDALTTSQLDHLTTLGAVVLLVLVGEGTPRLPREALLRATLRAAELLPDALVVAVPLARRDEPAEDAGLRAAVVSTYAGGGAVAELPTATDADHPPEIARIVAAARPGPGEQGLVLFFTGLSGSGKSTLARALTDLVLEQGTRTVTSLDGDVVRRNLSAGLTFSREDRETNIRRIGWVAAEIARHGGVAVVSPIAPYDETRQQVRAMVEAAGGAFFLVHVATPLAECERRDRKGLYAKARRGEIPEFTGISSPYEEPRDADVRVDTTGRTIPDALGDVMTVLHERGYLSPSVVEERAPASVSKPPTPHSDAPLKVLFVCTANICRSPTMELLARHLLPEDTDVVFTSAGTRGYDDAAADHEVAAWLEQAGVASTDFRSRPLTRALLEEADLVLTAEASHRAFILDDHPAMFRKVLTLGQLAEALGRLDPTLPRAELVRLVGETRRNADRSFDVADPYRRGTAAVRTAAEQIRGYLDVVLPALSRRR